MIFPEYTFLNRYTELPWLVDSGDRFSLVLYIVHPFEANACEKFSIDPIRLLVILQKRETEQQSQLLIDPEEEEDGASTAEKTSLKRPLERETKDRRWEREEAERDGKESITASFGRDHDRDDDTDAEDDQVEGCDDEEIGDGDGDPDSREGNEKMM